MLNDSIISFLHSLVSHKYYVDIPHKNNMKACFWALILPSNLFCKIIVNGEYPRTNSIITQDLQLIGNCMSYYLITINVNTIHMVPTHALVTCLLQTGILEWAPLVILCVIKETTSQHDGTWYNNVLIVFQTAMVMYPHPHLLDHFKQTAIMSVTIVLYWY